MTSRLFATIRIAVMGAAFAGFALAALPSDDALAQPRGRGNDVERGRGDFNRDRPSSVEAAIFTELERRLIGDYYRRYPHQGGPAGKGLPPGIRKNLARGKPLPPGIAKQFLPGELERQLPYRSNYQRLVVGDDIYLVQQATGLILDIIEGALRPRRR
jgi:hypothetical protein